MSVEKTRKITPGLLPRLGDTEQIGVLTEQHSVELRRALQERGIVELGGFVFVASRHIDAAQRRPSVIADGT